MSRFRPLPAHPSIEFERKAAKALLRELRAGDAEAWQRMLARHESPTSAWPPGA